MPKRASRDRRGAVRAVVLPPVSYDVVELNGASFGLHWKLGVVPLEAYFDGVGEGNWDRRKDLALWRVLV